MGSFQVFSQASDIMGFDLSFTLDCTAAEFEDRYNLSFIGDNSTFHQSEYELSEIDSGVSVRVYGSYGYIVGEMTFTPILIISRRHTSGSGIETAEQYFVAFKGFVPNGSASGMDTITAAVGRIELKQSYYGIRIYKGKPMVNNDIYIRYGFMLEEREWQTWQGKIPHVTKIRRARS